MSIVVVFDFDQTICDTSSIEHLRDARDWTGCRRQGAGLPFYDGVAAAIATLKDAGMIVGVASNSPKADYLAAFVERLEEEAGVELDFVYGFWEGAELEPVRGTSGKRLIKAAQLADIQREYPDDEVVMIGDDKADAWACKVLQIPFGHACWDSDCPDYCQAHFDEPSELTRSAVRKLSQEYVRPWTAPPVDTAKGDGFTWARATLDRSDIPAAFLDFYHKRPCYEGFCDSNAAMERFKDGAKDVAGVFDRAIAVVSREFAGTAFDFVVPVIGSKAKTVKPSTPVGGLARAVAAVLKKPVAFDMFEQDPRESLSGGAPIGFDARYARVYKNLRVVGNQKQPRVLLVDDVITSGATAKAYADRLAQKGGRVVGIVGVMKTEQCEPLLNPELYPALAA